VPVIRGRWISGRWRAPGNDHQGICSAGGAIHSPDCTFRPAGARLRLDIRPVPRNDDQGQKGGLNFLSAREANHDPLLLVTNGRFRASPIANHSAFACANWALQAASWPVFA
jgi:hypothetical protein